MKRKSFSFALRIELYLQAYIEWEGLVLIGLSLLLRRSNLDHNFVIVLCQNLYTCLYTMHYTLKLWLYVSTRNRKALLKTLLTNIMFETFFLSAPYPGYYWVCSSPSARQLFWACTWVKIFLPISPLSHQAKSNIYYFSALGVYYNEHK